MTITPDQARELLDGATPGPWYVHTDPDLAQTVIEQGKRIEELEAQHAEWEYTFQTRPRGLPWRQWTTQEDWFDTRDAAYRAAVNVQDAGSFNCRLVRRLVGPVEEAE